MDQNKQDAILRTYSRLTALRANLPKIGRGVDEKFVQEYHDISNVLESASGMKLEEFRIPDSELKREMTSYTPALREYGQVEQTTYTDERYCSRDFLLSKLDALLMYFKLINNPGEKPEIGFKA